MLRSRSSHRRSDVAWHPEFTRRRNLNLRDLGKSYPEWRAESEAESPGEGVVPAQDALRDADIVSMYMMDDGEDGEDGEDSEDSEKSAAAHKVEEFCPKTTLGRLMTGGAGGGPSSKLVALFVERGLDGGIISERHNCGPKTAPQLYQGLREPRGQSNDTHPSDVRHRHVFLTDLDPWGICAIFGGAPRYHRNAIRSLIYRHLQPRPYIRVNIRPDGRRFEFEFHLHHTLTRHSNEPNVDTRRFAAKDTPLREYRNVSYLNLKANRRQTHRYEAQISYLLTGWDESTWDTYCIKDNYFKSGKGGESLKEIYEEVSQAADESVAIDPSTRCEPEPDTPTPDPRQKFLRTLRYNLKRVEVEYGRNTDRVCDSIRDYTLSEHDRQRPSERRPSDLKVHGLSTIEWITKVKDLSELFLMELSDLVDVTDGFLDAYQTLFTTDLCTPQVSKIRDILREMECLKKSLVNAITVCKSLDESEQNRLKQSSADAGRKAEFLSKFIYPVLITAGMFSMEKQVLPFKENTATFLCALLFIGLLIHLSYDWSWYRELVVSAADSVGLRRGAANSSPYDQSAEPAESRTPTSRWRRRDLQAAAPV
ncbi:hypothetical protein PV04_05258 [Phialophora macrospora]|uniref:Uncharacterized protein n=1 Tax=Phialophora macrospora TaxID=1851006 RepID=A0A0D2E4V7_9EURO|nr:hypothetical protein PV04_05258 [Phialophora macrospora]